MSSGLGSEYDYSGADNLDVMRFAVQYNAALVNLIRKYAGRGRTLDFGAGIGTFSKLLDRDGYRVECLEPDAAMAARLTDAGFLVHDSLQRTPDTSFDIVIMLNVLEHIEDDAGILREIKGKLVPGGRLFIYVPAFQMLYSSMDKKVGHVRRYTRKTLAKRLDDAGYNILVAKYSDSMGFFASIVFKVFGSSDGTITESSIRKYDRWFFPASAVADRVCNNIFGKNVFVVAQAADT